MKLAFFDIDGTLLAGSTERRFSRYLLRKGYLGPRQVASFLWFLLRHIRTYGRDVLKKNKAYLDGIDVERIRALAEEFVAAEVMPQLYAPVVQRLQRHLKAGDTAVLLSGTLEPIARALGAALGVQHVCATICDERQGRYTSAAPHRHPFGAVKRTLATWIATEMGADLRDAAAYGDSRHDLELLEAVGHPVAVRPDAPLLATARGNRWDIIAGREGPHIQPQ
jgi:HAD superfamily hydrolase (TIGR01490 family)